MKAKKSNKYKSKIKINSLDLKYQESKKYNKKS